MAKEKVFIILTHKNVFKKGSTTEWEVQEIVEFVNEVRKRHYSYSSCIGDYINKKMITGSRYGMGDWETFMDYVSKKYAKQIAELNAAYRPDQVQNTDDTPVFVDAFGNIRARTVFDPA